MSEDWCTIESDPGLFTELISNIGVKNIQVNEILDFDIIESNTTIYGVIFLFKYMSKSNYKPNVLKEYDNELYFAKQVIVNACATQAILSIILNNDCEIEIGETLKELKLFSNGMDPTLKGVCFSNCEKVKKEHNKFSKPNQFIETSQKRAATDDDDVFHFVSYIHFKDSIYEIDGIQDGPILIKKDVDKTNWIQQLKPYVMERISLYSESEIKFNLMYVTDCNIGKYKDKIKDITSKIEYIYYIQNNSNSNDIKINNSFKEINEISKDNNKLNNMLSNLLSLREDYNCYLNQEQTKREESRLENQRRQHNYIPLIFEMLKHLSEKGLLEDCYNQAKEEQEKEKLNKLKK